VFGNSSLDAESLVAIEGGYRGQLADNLTFDFAAFHHDYNALIVPEQGFPFFDTMPVPHAVVPRLLTNSGVAKTWGLEGVVNWQPVDVLRVELTFGYFDASKRNSIGSNAQTVPYHQAAARILYQVTPNARLNVIGRYIGRTPSSGLGNYFDLDAALQWNVNEHIEVGLVGRNLIAGKRAEFAADFLFAGGATLIQPNAALTLKWRN
jgi:outer membrane receptor protein involved in Fe transport